MGGASTLLDVSGHFVHYGHQFGESGTTMKSMVGKGRQDDFRLLLDTARAEPVTID